MNKAYKFLQDPDFLQIKNTLNGLMKDRAKEGLGNQPKQAEVITLAEEERMWATGVLGSDNPTQLLNTLIYFIGLNFALRSEQEHRNLRHLNSQLSVYTDQMAGSFYVTPKMSPRQIKDGSNTAKLSPRL